jgi:archaellum component FlaF (FlaF/FlaG flagellin family)
VAHAIELMGTVVRVFRDGWLVGGGSASASTEEVVSVKGRPVIAFVLLAGLLVVPAYVAPTASAATDSTTRVSVATNGTQANSDSFGSAISADGRYVAFESEASNLVDGDNNGTADVFVRDRVAGATTRVSLTTGGTQANGGSYLGAISADGRFVAFYSMAGNLVAGDTNGTNDVFVHDRVTGTTTRISVATSGTQANDHSELPTISADGHYVAFSSGASNLVTGDTNGAYDGFVHDRVTGTTTRASVATDGTQANGRSSSPAISADGRYVAFPSEASNLVASDTNGKEDVFVHDQVTGTTSRASVTTDGTQAIGDSNSRAISGDGRYVAFNSSASNLVTSDTNGKKDVFVHDQVTGATTRVSLTTGGAQANDDVSGPTISADGHYVAFSSWATNLVADDTNSVLDGFVHDRDTGSTTRVSLTTSGAQANDGSGASAISADGRYVTFQSAASNLVPGDTNGRLDVFVRDRLTPGLAAVTRLSDFNRDGVTDLVARDAAGRLWLYPGNGSGEFKSRRQMGVGWNTMTTIVTPGDVTGDRNGDIIGRDTAGRLWLYPGNGASRFLAKRLIGSGWNTMTAITNAANLNGTGRPDLLARDTTGALWLYPLTGNTVFGPRSKIGTGWNGYTILGPGDVSGDGRADILARDPAGSLWLYRGTGTGRVGGRTLVSSGWAPMTALVTPGNWDRAAGNDVLARNAAGTLWLHPGNNAGSLGAPRQIGTGWQAMTYLG